MAIEWLSTSAEGTIGAGPTCRLVFGVPASYCQKGEEKVEQEKKTGRCVKGANGTTYEYRRTAAVLERRPIYSGIWSPVRAGHFETMLPAELRLVADLIEEGSALAG